MTDDIDNHGLRPGVFAVIWLTLISASATISGTLIYLLWKAGKGLIQ